MLLRTGFLGQELRDRLGEPDPRLSPAEQESLWWWRARDADRLALLARLFLLQRPVPLRVFHAAFGSLGLGPWQRLGLVRVGGARVNPAVQLAAHGELVVASDLDTGALSAEHVQGGTTATMLLARMTIRTRVQRALDLGTGAGYLALRLTDHADQVVASDVSDRALAYTRVNAALNGRALLPLRSDRFASVRGQFDLVTGNLPFVISPDRRFTFRDTGARGDGFLASVVRATGRHLVEGGHAQYLAQWAHRAGEREDERLAPWIVASGCDALIVRLEEEPVDQYAARWLAGPQVLDRRARERRLARWMAHYARAGITHISTGLWTLRRRKAERHFLLIDEATPAAPPSGEEILARFRKTDRARTKR